MKRREKSQPVCGRDVREVVIVFAALAAVVAALTIVAVLAVGGVGATPEPTATPTPEHCGMSDRSEPLDCLTPCADNEERLEDGICRQVFPPVDWGWECEELETCPAVASSIVRGPTSLPDTGGGPEVSFNQEDFFERVGTAAFGIALLFGGLLFLSLAITRRKP